MNRLHPLLLYRSPNAAEIQKEGWHKGTLGPPPVTERFTINREALTCAATTAGLQLDESSKENCSERRRYQGDSRDRLRSNGLLYVYRLRRTNHYQGYEKKPVLQNFRFQLRRWRELRQMSRQRKALAVTSQP